MDESHRLPFPLKQARHGSLGTEFGHERRASHVHGGAFRIVAADRFLVPYPQPVHLGRIARHLGDERHHHEDSGSRAEAETSQTLFDTDGEA